GPGDGRLMADVLRLAEVRPDFFAAAEIILVERSAPLAERPKRALGECRRPIRWLEDWDALLGCAGPVILLANEFLDCLPVDQWMRTKKGLAERRVGLSESHEIGWATGPEMIGMEPGPEFADMSEGEVIESSAEARALGHLVGGLVRRRGGAALFIDYGEENGLGDTLQAVRGHRKESPFANPGESDLTCHADFRSLLAAARGAGAATRFRTQGEFLLALGAEQRALGLSQAHPEKAETIGRQLDRLLGADQMGALFKVAAIHSAGLEPPGF
ncbi:MAG: SAM-dependent methyltransferase, partial [Caulobacteraceae bacterium]